MGDSMVHTQLALDPQGRLRVLLVSWPSNDVWHYQYGACDTGCTNSNNWRLSTVVTGKAYSFLPYSENNQSFTLDAQGRPRFVYYVNPWGIDPNQASVFYTYCNTGCTDAASWSITRLTDSEWADLQLALTSAGLPRLAFTLNTGEPNYETRLAYIECASADCTSWSGIPLVTAATYSPGSGPVFSLCIDTAGQPRLAYYPGTGSGGTLETGKLYYLACDTACNQAGPPPSWMAHARSARSQRPGLNPEWRGWRRSRARPAEPATDRLSTGRRGGRAGLHLVQHQLPGGGRQLGLQSHLVDRRRRCRAWAHSQRLPRLHTADHVYRLVLERRLPAIAEARRARQPAHRLRGAALERWRGKQRWCDRPRAAIGNL
jgi:hypothetical protein